MLCAYLSAGLLVGLGANAVLGWWGADPLYALAIAGVAVREGVLSWRGEPNGCCARELVSKVAFVVRVAAGDSRPPNARHF